MIDPEGTAADGLRTLWVWFLVSPALQPLLQLLPELGLVLGVTLPQWLGLLLGGLVAGGIVGIGERRYGRLVVAAFATVLVWVVARRALGVTDARVHGVPRLVLADFLLWLGAVSLVVAAVFYTEWESLTGSDTVDER